MAAGERGLLALLDNGTLISTASDRAATAAGVREVKKIGGYAPIGIRTNGTIFNLPGYNFFLNVTNAVAVAGGIVQQLVLTADGLVQQVTIRPHFETQQSEIPPDLDQLTAIACGWQHSLAVRADGTVVAWGRNIEGQCDVPTGLSNVVAIAAARQQSMALRTDRTVVTWGECP